MEDLIAQAGTAVRAGRLPLDFRCDVGRFDPGWYRAAYPDPPIGNAIDALAHFIDIGSRQGRQPSAAFDPDWYLERYPRAAAAVASDRLRSAFHDYLLRRHQGLPRRAAPARFAVGADLKGVAPTVVDLVLRLAARAPAWDFRLVAPAGSLPDGPAGANLSIVPSADRLPPIDLWLCLDRGHGPPVPAIPVTVPPSTGRSAAAIDRLLEALRRRVLADCPVVPVRRRDSGPVHLDPARVDAVRIAVRRVGPGASGGGVVLRASGRIVAELPPPADEPLVAVTEAPGVEDLWLTVSPGLEVELTPAAAPVRGLDLIVSGEAGQPAEAWRRTVEAAAALRPAGRLVVVDPPPRLDLPAGTPVPPTVAEALTAGIGPAMLVPVGVRLFPQAVSQASAQLGSGAVAYTACSAIRHPDGHLAPWPAGGRALDPTLFARWSRGHVTVLPATDRTPVARQLPAQLRSSPPAVSAAALAAIEADAWPSRLRPQRARAPDWLRVDARPDGAVIGRLRLRGDRLTGGGRLLLTGTTDGALAAPCPVVARSGRRAGPGAATTTVARFVLPEAGCFAWEIELPGGPDAADTLEILPDGPWRTRQDGDDARPLLFRLQSVRYRSPSTSPSATSRSR